MFETPVTERAQDERIDELLSGSEPVVLCRAGRTLRKVESSKHRDVDKQTLKDLVACSQQSPEAAAIASAPTNEVDYRERKTGCLKRATSSWHELIKLLEATRVASASAEQAPQRKGALFAEIAAAARRSLTLREKFKQRFPPHFGGKEKNLCFARAALSRFRRAAR